MQKNLRNVPPPPSPDPGSRSINGHITRRASDNIYLVNSYIISRHRRPVPMKKETDDFGGFHDAEDIMG